MFSSQIAVLGTHTCGDVVASDQIFCRFIEVELNAELGCTFSYGPDISVSIAVCVSCGEHSSFHTDSRRNNFGKLCGIQDRERRAQGVTVEVVDRRACRGGVSVDIEQTGLSKSGDES